MIRIILLFLLPLSIYASKILSYNIYDRTDRTDVMITFDVPYEGIIKKSKTSSKIIIKLEDASIESSKLKQVSSEYIKTLALTQLSNHVQIVATISDGVELKVSKTADAYGLRLRFQKGALNYSSNAATASTSTKQKPSLSALPTKKADDMTQSYYIVITILVIGIIILYVIKRKVTPANTPKDINDKKDLNKKTVQKGINNIPDTNSSEVSIRFQKNIDETNSVVMLDFLDHSYLVMMGSNNVLLDRFNENIPSSEEEFNVILQEHQQMLESFLSNQSQDSESGVKSYSQKASTISYNA